MNCNDQAWAVFRCSLLKPVLLGEISASERGAYFRELSRQEHLLPNGTRKKISERTLRRWWKKLRDAGIAGLAR
jgi:DNA-binding transcriptional ArsR family regulator